MAKGKQSVIRGRWTKDEVRLLKKIFRNTSTEAVALDLCRTIAGVQAKASSLGLRKTKKYLRSIRKG